MSDSKWYRVVDPLNPLFGCDVRGHEADQSFPDGRSGLVVTAMRRVDIFVGDRPFQLVAPDEEDLGIMIDDTHLEDAPIQDETVELQTDRPFGICLDESELTRKDGHTLRIARYERATQVALSDPQEELLGTRTFASDPSKVLDSSSDEARVLRYFEENCDPDEIVYLLKRRG